MSRLNVFVSVALISLSVLGSVSMAQASVATMYAHYDKNNDGYLNKTELEGAHQAVSDNFGKYTTDPSCNSAADLNDNGFVNHADRVVVDDMKKLSTKKMIDLNGNDEVEYSEIVTAYELVQTNFGRGVGDTGYNPMADFDPTDFINFADYGAVKNVASASETLNMQFNEYLLVKEAAKQQVDLNLNSTIRLAKNARLKVNNVVRMEIGVTNSGRDVMRNASLLLIVNNDAGQEVYREQKTVPELKKREQSNVSFAWTPSVAGRYSIKIEGDVNNNILEINEKNNIAATSLKIVK
jgi:CARDB/EF-hand domain pair